jgi:hypothetical protein
VALIHGVPVQVSTLATASEFVRKPRTKRRRIVKKWRKRAENWRHAPAAYQMAGLGLVVHPAIYERMQRILKANP